MCDTLDEAFLSQDQADGQMELAQSLDLALDRCADGTSGVDEAELLAWASGRPVSPKWKKETD